MQWEQLVISYRRKVSTCDKDAHWRNFLETVQSVSWKKLREELWPAKPWPETKTWNHHVKSLCSGLNAFSPCTHPHTVHCTLSLMLLFIHLLELLNRFRKTKWLRAWSQRMQLWQWEPLFTNYFQYVFRAFCVPSLLFLCITFWKDVLRPQKNITEWQGLTRHSCLLSQLSDWMQTEMHLGLRVQTMYWNEAKSNRVQCK